MQTILQNSLNDVIKAAQALQQPKGRKFIEKAARMIAECCQRKNKVLIAGNGGSLCDAMHFAEELSGQYRKPRPALAALALADPAHMSCVGNDFGFDRVFARGIEAFGAKGDLFVALTTSGNSENIYLAVQQAQKTGMQTIAFLGKTGGKMKGVCDLEWIVDGFPYSDRIQEAHMAAIHVVIELVEAHLFSHLSPYAVR